jgi:cation/acetate symporter
MEQASESTEVRDQLRRICGLCALGFTVFIVVLVGLEKAGAVKTVVGSLFVLCPLALYAGIGLSSHAPGMSEFQIAGRRVPAIFAGMSAGAEWSAPIILLGTASALLVSGYDGRWLLIGLTGGYVLLAVLVLPFLRNVGARSVPDFMTARFGRVVGLLAVVVLVACSQLFAVALIQEASAIVSRALGRNDDVALYVVLAAVLLCTLAGGMRALTAVQVAQYVALTIGCLALFVIFEVLKFDSLAGSTYDPIAAALEAIVRGSGLAPAHSPRDVSFGTLEAVSNLELILCLMAGTVSLPHIVTRGLTTPSTREARASAGWSLLFIALLTFVMPTYVALTNVESSRELSGVIFGLVAAVGATAMLATASSLMLTIANSLDNDVYLRLFSPNRGAPAGRAVVARLLLVASTAFAAYLATVLSPEPGSMVAWAFSLAAAGYFPALALGIWWARTTSSGAVCGIMAGFGICLGYIVMTRYFPQAATTYLSMTSLRDPANGQALVNVAQVLADPKWVADVPASAGNPLTSAVGWLNVGNLAAGVLGMSLGFAITITVSLLGKAPSGQSLALLDAIRAPHGKPVPKLDW